MNKILNYAEGVMLTNDVDTKKGLVKFYYARFDSPDANNRLMHKNAFNRTVTNNIDKIYHLNNHEPTMIIGKPQEFGKDEKGAWVVSKLSQNSDGRKALTLYDEGVYKFHSFGYYIINSSDADGTELVTEARIAEVSTVLYPAHTDATTIQLNKEQSQILNKLDELLALASQHSNSQSESTAKDTINFINAFQL